MTNYQKQQGSRNQINAIKQTYSHNVDLINIVDPLKWLFIGYGESKDLNELSGETTCGDIESDDNCIPRNVCEMDKLNATSDQKCKKSYKSISINICLHLDCHWVVIYGLNIECQVSVVNVLG